MKEDYIIDFVIPEGQKGETGPVGPQGDMGPRGPRGPRGPMGPTSLHAVLSLNYNNTNLIGNLPLSNNKLIIPSNTNIFTLQTTEFILNEQGIYEFTIYGLLKETSMDSGATLTVNVGNEDLIHICLESGVYEIYFSRSQFKECAIGEQVVLNFNKQSTSNAVLESVYLIVKKYVF